MCSESVGLVTVLLKSKTNLMRVLHAREGVNNSYVGSFKGFADDEWIHNVTAVLMTFLRELPQPVLTFKFYEDFIESREGTKEMVKPSIVFIESRSSQWT